MVKLFMVVLFILSCLCCQQQITHHHNVGDQWDKDTAKKAKYLSKESPHESNWLIFQSGIRCVLQDTRGHYWFGSHQEGVARFDGSTYQYFTNKNGLADNQVRTIEEDNQGYIWFGTANGVSRYDGVKIRNLTPVDIPYNVSFSSDNWSKNDNDLWFAAGVRHGVYRYNGETVEYLEFPKDYLTDPSNSYAATAFSKGKNNTIWMATYANAMGYDGRNFSVIHKETTGLDIGSNYFHVRSILGDRQGRLWIGNNGLGVLLKNGDTITNFSELKGLVRLNSPRNGSRSPAGTLEHVFAIFEDSKGHIWFGDRDTGAWKYDGTSIINYTIDANLESPMIWDIYEDHYGRLLFAMADGGVYMYNGVSFDKKF